jgi:DNA-binding phage protein
VANVVVSALATWNGKALKKAKQDVDVFNKQLKTLARTFGVTFSAAAIVGFSKKAIKAFSDDEAAARRLALQLENTGNAFRVDEVEGYIKSLEKTYAILNDLRGPFQTLLNLTGSVELAQRSLEAALNISAGTGESLSTVISAIASGIRGQTKAIKNLNTGIDANIIASGDMNKIMEALERRFSGQSAARLDTYAGKMDVLKKGVDEATKAIGEGLVDSLEILSRDTSVQTMADNFENMGNNIAYATVQIAKLTKGFSDLVGHPSFKAGLLATGLLLSGRTGNPKFFLAAMGVVGGSAGMSALTKDYSDKTSANTANVRESRLNQAFRTSIKYRTIENNQIKAKTELDKLAEKFDVERIGLMKALSEATDAETKLRIQAKIAILDNNEALAKKYNAELEASNSARALAESAKNAADALNTMPNKFDQIFKNVYEQLIAAGSSVAGARSGAGSSSRYAAEAEDFFAGKGKYAPDLNPTYTPGTNQTNQGTTNIDVTVNTGAVLSTNQDLTTYIQDALGNITKLGNGALVPAGSIAFQ